MSVRRVCDHAPYILHCKFELSGIVMNLILKDWNVSTMRMQGVYQNEMNSLKYVARLSGMGRFSSGSNLY